MGNLHFVYAFFGHDRHTNRHTYISHEISIEHPSVGLASLAQLLILLDKTWNKLISEHVHHPEMQNMPIGVTRVVAI